MEQRIDTSALKNRLGFNGKVQMYFSTECARHMNKYVPFKTGSLRRLIDIQKDYVEYQSPYARFLYYGKLMLSKTGSSWAKYGEKKYLTDKNLRYHTPNTGAYWDKLMWSAEGKNIIKDTERFIKNG